MLAYYLKIYLSALVAFLVLDLIWLGAVARGFYRKQLGFLLAEQVNWWAAICFYLLFVAGVLVFAIAPGLQANSLARAVLLGGLLGLVTYATYDLTNLATLKDWPLIVTLVDLAGLGYAARCCCELHRVPGRQRAALNALKDRGRMSRERSIDDTDAGSAVPDRPPEASELMTLKDRALDVAAEGVTIADARRPDRPLIYANEGFERMTGYPVAEVLGRNCRFLQGPGTEAASVDEIRAALAECRPCVVEILNYRKDGTTFWNRLSITPVRDSSGAVTHFIGIQSDVTDRRQAEDGLRRAKKALEHDLRLAARVQRALLPPTDVEAKGLRIAHAFHPCDDLAGDGVGIVPLPGDRVGLYLLDVSGHGVGAALLSFTLNHLLSPSSGGALLWESPGAAPSVTPPARVAERLNRQFPMERSRQYFTFVYGVIEPASGQLRYVIAGHPAPVLLPRVGAPLAVAGGGFPIGMLDDAVFQDEILTLEPGDRLYFYTDGVIEALNDAEAEFGFERLCEEIARYRDRPLRAALDLVAGHVRDWCGGRLRDDVSLLAVERAR
jgi:sigma-B regulation protein RsbU (phosphoserine phosphatase)